MAKGAASFYFKMTALK